MKRAYSYVRFSTAEQLKGKSLERQTEGARNYCKQHGLELDTELSLHDLGVSAFRGKNSDTGALGAFQKAVHVGQVPKGSLLLIETFDRMSRESAYDAQLTLQNIINAGITVVTLMDGKQYNVTILRTNPFALIEAILLMARSHEESATKSKRVADAWRRKRDDLKTGKIFTSITPGWLTLDKHRKPKAIPDRAKVVRRIYTSFIAGEGRTTIAANLNRDQVPTFGGGRWWTERYVHICLTSRAVLGEFQPCRNEHNGITRKRIRVAEGPPVKRYWPQVIDVRTFDKVQARLIETRGKRVTQTVGLKNILAGLGRCPLCGALMERIIKRPKSYEYIALVCCRAKAEAGCKYKFVQLHLIEQALAVNADALAAEVPDTSAELGEEIATLEAQHRELEIRIYDTAKLVAETPSKTLAQRIRDDEAECDRILAEIARAQAQLQYGSARRVRDSVTRMRAALQWHATDPGDAAGVNAALRECFEKIVVDYPRTRLELHWRHGQTTIVPYGEG